MLGRERRHQGERVSRPILTPPPLSPLMFSCLTSRSTPVQLYDCNGTPAQSWVWNRANTKIRLAGSSASLLSPPSPLAVPHPS